MTHKKKETTKMQASGTFAGSKVVLLWEKGKDITLKDKDEELNKILQLTIDGMYLDDKLFGFANNYYVEKGSALWAYIIFSNIFEKLENIEMNGEEPTIPYEEGVIY